jgi:uncharacterized membrane protein
MSLFLKFVLGFLALAHVGFFVLEWCWLDFPDFQTKLGFKGPDQAEVAIVGKNQAFSNLVLATGVAVCLVGIHWRKEWGRPFALFFLSSIALAGMVGFATIPESKSSFLILQSGPALLGLALLFLTRNK